MVYNVYWLYTFLIDQTIFIWENKGIKTYHIHLNSIVALRWL